MVARFDEAARHLKLEPGLSKVLKHPEKQLIVGCRSLWITGRTEVFTGYRVLHTRPGDPAMGGIRFDMQVTLAEVKGARRLDDLESAPVVNLPFGGSKGG
jgi:glutamate dehydrogenase (NAD(P)+)